MVQTLNEQPHITFNAVTSDIFFDYGQLLDVFYKNFPSGSIQGNHVFWVEAANPTTVYTRESWLDITVSIDFKSSKFSRDADRLEQLNNFTLQGLQPPGLRDIKQVELYSKWRKFVPAEFADDICPKPSDEVLARVAQTKGDKSRERAAAKRRKNGSAGRGRGRGRGRGSS
jgi:hypothetical protein